MTEGHLSGKSGYQGISATSVLSVYMLTNEYRPLEQS